MFCRKATENRVILQRLAPHQRSPTHPVTEELYVYFCVHNYMRLTRVSGMDIFFFLGFQFLGRKENILPHIPNTGLKFNVNPFTPRVRCRDIKVILTFESVNEIVRCDHSNETLSAALSHGAIIF